MLNPGEDRLQGVIVALRDGVEFMIVTFRAADREPQEREACGRHQIVQVVQPLLARQFHVGATDHVVSAGDQKTRRGVGARLIAGELITNEIR